MIGYGPPRGWRGSNAWGAAPSQRPTEDAVSGDHVERLRAKLTPTTKALILGEGDVRDFRVALDELEQLRSERDEFRCQRNEWVSDMHAAFAAGLETPSPATSEQSWRLSQGWIADRVAERQATPNGGGTT